MRSIHSGLFTPSSHLSALRYEYVLLEDSKSHKKVFDNVTFFSLLQAAQASERAWTVRE